MLQELYKKSFAGHKTILASYILGVEIGG